MVYVSVVGLFEEHTMFYEITLLENSLHYAYFKCCAKQFLS